MDNNSQTDSFMFDLDNLIRRYQQEFDLNDQTIVGALEFAKLTVLTDAEILFTVDECSQSEYDVFGNESNDGNVLDDDSDEDYDGFLSPQFWTAIAPYNKHKDGLQNVRITNNDGTAKAAVYKMQ